MSYKNLTESQLEALNETAKRIDVPASWLAELIQHESNFNPAIKNPHSSARGLIQFMDSTAKGLGFKSSLDLVLQNPTIESQLRGPVAKYLLPYAPFSTNAELYLAVFYPALRKSGYATLLPANVQAANKGIKTPAHYVAFQKNRLSEYESGAFDISDVIEKNSGFVAAQSVADLIPASTKRIQDIVSGVLKKKTILIPLVILALTIYAARNHISPKRQKSLNSSRFI